MRATDIPNSKNSKRDFTVSNQMKEKWGPHEKVCLEGGSPSLSASLFFSWFFPEGNVVIKLYHQVIMAVKASIISKRKCIFLARTGTLGLGACVVWTVWWISSVIFLSLLPHCLTSEITQYFQCWGLNIWEKPQIYSQKAKNWTSESWEFRESFREERAGERHPLPVVNQPTFQIHSWAALTKKYSKGFRIWAMIKNYHSSLKLTLSHVYA